jgi:hypothetical protein
MMPLVERSIRRRGMQALVQADRAGGCAVRKVEVAKGGGLSGRLM